MAKTNILEKSGIEPTYNVKDLYVGELGRMRGYTKFVSEGNYIIFRREQCYEARIYNFNLNYVGVDIITGKKYIFSKGEGSQHCRLLDANQNSLVIGNYKPLEFILDSPRDTISKSELLELYKNLNWFDPLINTILAVINLVKELLLEDDFKQKLLGYLDELGQYYTDEMNKISDGEENFETEHTVIEKTMRRLIELQEIILDPRKIKSYMLEKQDNK